MSIPPLDYRGTGIVLASAHGHDDLYLVLVATGDNSRPYALQYYTNGSTSRTFQIWHEDYKSAIKDFAERLLRPLL